MDDSEFEAELQRIKEINEAEPPKKNIFENKYKARSELTALRTKLVDKCKETPSDVDTQSKAARVHIAIASNLFETEEYKEGYEYLERAEDVYQTLRKADPYDWTAPFINGKMLELRTRMDGEIDYKFIDRLLECLNLGGYAWCAMGDAAKAKKLLHHAESIYKNYDSWARGQGDTGVEGLAVSDDGTVDEKQKLRAAMESQYTSTLFYCAQVYGNEAKSVESTKYCHMTLHRQLASKKEFDRVEWAINAMGLCSFYLTENDFGAAKHCLDAAESVFEQIPEKEKEDERVAQAIANMHQAHGKWVYYYLKLHRDLQTNQGANEPSLPETGTKFDWWESFPLPIDPPKPPPPIPPPGAAGAWDMVLGYFKAARKRYRKALEWFVFDGFVTDHIQILQDLSQLFRMLVHWDRHDDELGKQIDRHCALHQQRAKMLEGIPDQLNEKHYLNYMRQIWYEVGEIYNEIAELRLKQKTELKKSKPLSNKRINAIVEKSRGYFERFSNSFKTDGVVPSNLDLDLCNAFVTSRMHAIRLLTRRIAASPKDEYDDIELTVKQYKELIDWADAHPSTKKMMEEETTKLQIDMAREMTKLLPGKMADIRKAYMAR